MYIYTWLHFAQHLQPHWQDATWKALWAFQKKDKATSPQLCDCNSSAPKLMNASRICFPYSFLLVLSVFMTWEILPCGIMDIFNFSTNLCSQIGFLGPTWDCGALTHRTFERQQKQVAGDPLNLCPHITGLSLCGGTDCERTRDNEDLSRIGHSSLKMGALMTNWHCFPRCPTPRLFSSF